MTQDAVFLLHGSAMTTLRLSPYKTEAVLQKALAEFPEVIAGPTTIGDTTPGLLLIKRELGVPKVDGGSASFSIDHLFIDADAVPVLVEVKRSSDTRIRREVVGQMLDYVANGVAYWPVSDLRAALEASVAESTPPQGESGPLSADDVVRALSGLGVEEFWRLVEQNLRSGRVRLLFVADQLPPELIRVIEFLNEQMSPAEVLGVELRQYLGGLPGEPEHAVLVPRVVGRTSDAVAAKVRGVGGQLWNRESLLDHATERCSAQNLHLLKRILDDAERRGVNLTWGRGLTPSVGCYETVAGQATRTWMIQLGAGTPFDPARLELEFRRIVTTLNDNRRDLDRLDQTATILGKIPATADKLAKARELKWLYAPRFPLDTLTQDASHSDLVINALTLLADPGA